MDNDKRLIKALRGKKTETVPFWLMRQAGRYLPEYRALRQEAGSFLDLVFDSEKAAEVTLQPLRRFGMDGAILFADILLVPLALGQKVRFEPGKGPILSPLRAREDLSVLTDNRFDEILSPVYETVRQVRSGLERENFAQTALIGFAGAPWTVACYMVEGGSSRDFKEIKRWAYQDPAGFGALMDLLTQKTIEYLVRQIESGAEAVQIFDSWAGILDENLFRSWVIAPTQKIVSALQEKYPHIPVIGFPRGAGMLYKAYAEETNVTALGLDSQVPLSQAADLQKICSVQGNLDPFCLFAGGEALTARITEILDRLAGKGFVFNLGHGINKETPINHVEQLAEKVKSWPR